MIVSVFVLFVLYSVACILDGPDMGNGDITGFVRRVSAKQMLVAAKKTDREVYNKSMMFKYSPGVGPLDIVNETYDIRKFERSIMFNEYDVNHVASMYAMSGKSMKEVGALMFREFLNRAAKDFSYNAADMILKSKSFECMMDYPSSKPLIFTFSMPIAIPREREYAMRRVYKSDICDFSLPADIELEELMEYLLESSPYIIRPRNADKAGE